MPKSDRGASRRQLATMVAIDAAARSPFGGAIVKPQPAAPNDGSAARQPVPSDTRAARRPLRVLVAEDNRVNQELAQLVLRRHGHTVTVANNGCEALAALANEDFDVLLMDVQMPLMDGYQATAEIRRREALAAAADDSGDGRSGRRLPIIALTAHAMSGDRERCLAAGMDDYLSKPVAARDLLAAIDRAAEGLAASRPDTPDDPARLELDSVALLEYAAGSEDILREVVRRFLADNPDRVRDLRSAIGAGDATAVAAAAHGIKGTVKLFGAHEAAEIALRLERMGCGGDLTNADDLADALEQQIARLRAALIAFEPTAAPPERKATDSGQN